MKAAWIASISLCASAAAFSAPNIDQLNLLDQQDFRLLSQDLSAVASYKGVIPAEPLGVTGFDFGLEVSGTRPARRDVWQRASSSSVSSTVYVPKLRVHKGLPGSLDIGAFYSSVPGSDISLWGAELRYAILEGGVVQPALGARASYTKLTGLSQLDFHTKGLDLILSKGFALFTPYAGVGRVWTVSEPRVSNLGKEEFSKGKYFVGGNLNLGLVNLALEGDKTGGVTSYNAKVGFRF